MLGHFDIWDIWDLHVFWKMSVLFWVHHVYWWELSRKHSQMTLKARIHPPTPPKHTSKLKKHPQAPQTHPHDPQEQLWLLQNTRQTFWEAFGLSRDVREDSGGNESVRSCLLNVRDACECLGLLWQCLRIYQGWFRSVWGYLRVSLGVGRCKRGSGGCLVVYSFQFPSILGSHK